MTYKQKQFDFILTINQRPFKIFKKKATEISLLLNNYIKSNPHSNNYTCEIPFLNKHQYSLINYIFKNREITITEENFDFLDKIENFFKIFKLRQELESFQKDSVTFFPEELQELSETFQDLTLFEQQLFDFNFNIQFDIESLINYIQDKGKFFTNEILMEYIYNCCICRKKFIDFFIEKEIFLNEFVSFVNKKYDSNDDDEERIKQNLNDDQEYLFISSFLIQNNLKNNGLTQFNIFDKFDSNKIDHFLSKTIREDDVDQFQSFLISNPSYLNSHLLRIYNICNELDNFCDLLSYSAFFGSLKCFKFLLLNHYTIQNQVFLYAIAGGNTEIIRITETNLNSMKKRFENIDNVIEKAVLISIIYHRNNILEWLLNNNHIDFKENEIISENIFNIIIKYTNFTSLDLLVNNGVFNLFQFLQKNFQSILLKSDSEFDFWTIHILLLFLKKDYRQSLLTKNLKNGLSLLGYACEINNSFLFQILFDFKECRSINLLERKNYEGKIPIEVAIEKGNCEIIRSIFQFKEYQTKILKNSKINLIYYACKFRKCEIVEFIMNEYDKINLKIKEKLINKFDKSGV